MGTFNLGSALKLGVLLIPALTIGSAEVLAQGKGGNNSAACRGLPSHAELTEALKAVAPDAAFNGGLDTNMWATVVNRDGIVCAVTFSGDDRGDQWPGSRVISAQKANTANAFSLPGLALSTANLWTAVQPGGSTFFGGDPEVDPPVPPVPGGSLFGLQFSNPVDPAVAYKGPPSRFGQPNDPMVGEPIGGVNVFGGGLALYDADGTLLGAVGASGDTSCADHNIAWRVRDALGLDFVPAGVNPDTGDDNIIYDVVDTGKGNAVSQSGFGHPTCGFGAAEANEAVVAACPTGDGTSPDCVPEDS